MEGAAITDWRYKSSLHDESFQIRLHRGGDTHSGFTYPYTPKTVIANVWNADPEWRVTLCENGVETKAMTLVTTYTDAWSVGYHVGVLGRGDNYKSPCKHMYVAEPNDVRAALKVVAVDRWGNRYEQSEFTAPTTSRMPGRRVLMPAGGSVRAERRRCEETKDRRTGIGKNCSNVNEYLKLRQCYSN